MWPAVDISRGEPAPAAAKASTSSPLYGFVVHRERAPSHFDNFDGCNAEYFKYVLSFARSAEALHADEIAIVSKISLPGIANTGFYSNPYCSVSEDSLPILKRLPIEQISAWHGDNRCRNALFLQDVSCDHSQMKLRAGGHYHDFWLVPIGL
jgi:hypothetical protein